MIQPFLSGKKPYCFCTRSLGKALYSHIPSSARCEWGGNAQDQAENEQSCLHEFLRVSDWEFCWRVYTSCSGSSKHSILRCAHFLDHEVASALYSNVERETARSTPTVTF